MSSSRHKHHHEHKPKPSQVSIFNKVTVNAPVEQKSQVRDESKEDGCTSCFKALFKSLRR